jgi:environmental stress-induced protein Ves
MEIIRFAELRPEPWRNGGGVTRELASHPKVASAQDGAWDWRVSIAGPVFGRSRLCQRTPHRRHP